MAFLAILLVAFAATLQSLGDREAMMSPLRYRVWSVPSPEVVRRAALSFKTVLADVYWIRASSTTAGRGWRAEGRRTTTCSTLCST